MNELIQARMRPGQDDDIKAWYEDQANKSDALRAAVREYMRSQKEVEDDPERDHGEGLSADVLHAINETVELAVRRVMNDVTAELVTVVQEVLNDYRLTPRESTGDQEDPEVAAVIDEQLDDFFEVS